MSESIVFSMLKQNFCEIRTQLILSSLTNLFLSTFNSFQLWLITHALFCLDMSNAECRHKKYQGKMTTALNLFLFQYRYARNIVAL